jgi:protein-S-isoprenylcysteine O-methyltransferase Ste14
VIDAVWFWIAIGFLSLVALLWFIHSVFKGIRYETFQAIGLVFIILSLSLPETIGEYTELPYYTIIAASLAFLAIFMILLGILTSHRRWIKRKGTTNLNKFKNLMIFAYVRHPITLGIIIISFSLIFLINSILSNVLAIMAVISFFLSSYEKDSLFQESYGYPYRLYMKKVPRFNIIHGLIRSIIAREEEVAKEGEDVYY